MKVDGFNALDLIGEPVTASDLLKAEEFIKLNYGIDYQPEKFSLLWEMIIEAKWSKERLNRTLKWFLKTKKYPNWTISDWFEYEIKLFPYAWYLEMINKGYKHEDMCAYRINGKSFYKLNDLNELPFERIY